MDFSGGFEEYASETKNTDLTGHNDQVQKKANSTMCDGSKQAEYRNVDKVVITESERYRFDKKFAFLFPDMFLDAVQQLTRSELMVFFAILERMRYRNIARITRLELVSVTGMRPQHVSTAVTGLRKKGIIWKLMNGVFEVDPDIIWFGSAQEYLGKEPKSKRTHRPVTLTQDGEVITTFWFPKVPRLPPIRSRVDAGNEESTPPPSG